MNSQKMMNKRLLVRIAVLAVVTILAVLPLNITRAEEALSSDVGLPSITAVIDGDLLTIQATDTFAGIAGVQVNGLLYTNLDNDFLVISLSGTLSSYERLAVRAFDYEGNFTDPIHLDNPAFVADAMAETTLQPSTEAGNELNIEQPTPPVATEAPNESKPSNKPNTGISAVYVNEWVRPTAAQTLPEPTPIVQTVVETEYIPIGPGMPYKSDGNTHTLDVLYSAPTNKQFISLETKNGNTFYLVIDFDKPIDEEAELYETYFLNLVDERDLLDLMSDDDVENVPTPTPQIVYVTPAPSNAPIESALPIEEEPIKGNQSTPVLILAVLVLLGGIGAFLFLRKQKGRKRMPDNSFDMDDDDGADETNE